MELYFLSVGYGEAMVVLDGTHCLVIDGGPPADDPAYAQPGTIRLASFLAQKQVQAIDCMICTHLHNDHLSGLLETVRRFPVRQFWVNCWPQSDVTDAIEAALPACPDDLSLRLFTSGLQHFVLLREALLAQGTEVTERCATTGYKTLWPGCGIRLFGMDDAQIARRRDEFEAFCRCTDPAEQRARMRAFDKAENTCSLACSLHLDGHTVFLTGDLCSGWETRCAAPGFPQADILKLTHHGQRDGMPACLVDACDPSVFVMCADAARTFNSACDEVQARAQQYLAARGRPAQVYTTGLLGQAFPTADGALPCALCCTMQEPLTCTPYYAKEGYDHASV